MELIISESEVELELQLKKSKIFHEIAVLTARKLEIQKQLLEAKKSIAILQKQASEIEPRISGLQEQLAAF